MFKPITSWLSAVHYQHGLSKLGPKQSGKLNRWYIISGSRKVTKVMQYQWYSTSHILILYYLFYCIVLCWFQKVKTRMYRNGNWIKWTHWWSLCVQTEQQLQSFSSHSGFKHCPVECFMPCVLLTFALFCVCLIYPRNVLVTLPPF